MSAFLSAAAPLAAALLLILVLFHPTSTAHAAPSPPQLHRRAAVPIAYDPYFSNGALSTAALACGSFLPAGTTTAAGIAGFPFIGASADITWNSPTCSTACYTITYGAAAITVRAVDGCGAGFVLSLEAMDALTGGQAMALGMVMADAVLTDPAACGI
ncbi:allergenic cerato-platanin Asp F13 [Zopfochytrium polystomum]|nr:allergenic cerato-platanin Asp F13 [Zopfochytrium polystomum]